jgi:hypothetical protein
MIWTTRLKRHGGLQNLMAKRLRQMSSLQALISPLKEPDPMIQLAFDFLQDNPLRVLGADAERYFGWRN